MALRLDIISSKHVRVDVVRLAWYGMVWHSINTYIREGHYKLLSVSFTNLYYKVAVLTALSFAVNLHDLCHMPKEWNRSSRWLGFCSRNNTETKKSSNENKSYKPYWDVISLFPLA